MTDNIEVNDEGKPKEPRSGIGIFSAILGVLASGLFLLNLTAGIVEIPDNLPIVGNVDEVLASSLFLGCLSYLGIDLVPFRRKDQHGQRK